MRENAKFYPSNAKALVAEYMEWKKVYQVRFDSRFLFVPVDTWRRGEEIKTALDRQQWRGIAEWATSASSRKTCAVEMGSGFGDWILQRAKQSPEISWVALEISARRALSIMAKAIAQDITNLNVICGDARYVFSRLALPEIRPFNELYINFPEPLSVAERAGRAIISPRFVADAAYNLASQSGSKLHICTDEEHIAASMKQSFCTDNNLFFVQKRHLIGTDESYGESNYERIWREQGKKIHYVTLERR